MTNHVRILDEVRTWTTEELDWLVFELGVILDERAGMIEDFNKEFPSPFDMVASDDC